MSKKGFEEKFFSCSCLYPGHFFRVSYFDKCDIDKDPLPDLFVDVYLATGKFTQRLRHGIKYIFGLDNQECISDLVITLTQAEELRDFLNEYLEKKKDEWKL
jgi:hypothetical protein